MRRRLQFTLALALTAGACLAIAPRLGALVTPPAYADAVDGVLPATVETDPSVFDDLGQSPVESRDVDLVLCLDTSGSMEGLLDSARARLWDIVNEVSEREPDARLRVAVLTFGSPNEAPASQGFVRVRSGLTTDLDSLYEEVMSLRTAGGDEYVGWTLHTALTQLEWSSQDEAARLIFIAGNESADQNPGGYDFRQQARMAQQRGIVVNSIFAGDRAHGQNEHWAEVAAFGGGIYSHIDQHAGTHQVHTQYDAEINRLNEELNATYIPMGEAGQAKYDKVKSNDRSAGSLGSGSTTSRVAAKSSNQYDTSGWELVGAIKKGFDVRHARAEQLPAVMQDMSEEEREAYVDLKKDEQDQVKRKISELYRQRKAEVAAEAPAADGLDSRIESALDAQLQ